jgi:hypothetical protein
MKKHIVVTALLFLSFYLFSQTVIKLEEVSKHIGDSVTVCGKVSSVRFLETAKNSPTFINLGQVFPNHSRQLNTGLN